MRTTIDVWHDCKLTRVVINAGDIAIDYDGIRTGKADFEVGYMTTTTMHMCHSEDPTSIEVNAVKASLCE